MPNTGIHAVLDILAKSGVRYLFGNPGTTELPLSDALSEGHPIDYVMALQEVPVMAIADGYAQASRSPGVVNVHICCGLGNSMGAVAAGLMLGLIEAFSISILPLAFQDAVAIAILLIILFIRPHGLFGSSEAAGLKEF